MATVLDLVTDAYRESNLIAIGSVLSADQLTEGVTLLNRYRMSVYGTEAGEQLLSFPLGQTNISRPDGYPEAPDGDWIVPHNTRLYLNLSAAQTVYLNPNPIDGARFAFKDTAGNLATYNLIVKGNGRLIGGTTSATFSTNSQSREYFYRADAGDWKVLDPLVSTDTWPFPEEFDDMFVIGLAMRLNPRNVIQTSPESIAAYKRLLLMFEARYRQACQVSTELGLLRTSGIKRRYGNFSDNSFNTGYPFPPGIY